MRKVSVLLIVGVREWKQVLSYKVSIKASINQSLSPSHVTRFLSITPYTFTIPFVPFHYASANNGDRFFREDSFCWFFVLSVYCPSLSRAVFIDF